MAKLSLPQLRSLVNSIVTNAKLSNASFVETRDNIVGLLDKIGKIVTVDTVFAIDKLSAFDGEYLSFGKTIEEYQQDLILPVAHDPSGSSALAPHDPTYRPPFYSYTNGREYIPTTIRNDNIERAVHFSEQFVNIVAMQYKRLEDSMAQYRYGLKKEMLAKLIGLCNTAMTQSTTTYSASASYTVGTFIRSGSSSPISYGIVVKAITGSASETNSWANAVANGYIIVLDLVTVLAKPVDTSTADAFIKQVKADVEVFSDVSEGHSLNGNTLGASEGLVLIVKQGVMPNIEVESYAGAFQRNDIAIPTEVIVVNDFGSADNKYYAILMDKRGMRLHDTYNATRENPNGEGDFLNIFRHIETTAWISRNTAVKVYSAS